MNDMAERFAGQRQEEGGHVVGPFRSTDGVDPLNRAVAHVVAIRDRAEVRSILQPLSTGWEPPYGLTLGRYGLTGTLQLDPDERPFAEPYDPDSRSEVVELICGPDRAAFRSYYLRMKETSAARMDPFLVRCATYSRQPTQGWVNPPVGSTPSDYKGSEQLEFVLAYKRPRAGIVGHVKCIMFLERKENGRDLWLQVYMPNIAVLPRFRRRGIARDLLAGACTILDSWLYYSLLAAPSRAKMTLNLYVEVESAGGGRLADRLADFIERQTVWSLNEQFGEDGSRRIVKFEDDVG